MVEISQITDSSTLKTYLLDQPTETSQVIAVRSALRVLPNLQYILSSRLKEDRLEGFLLARLRTNLISTVACIAPAAEIKNFANSAAYSFSAAAPASVSVSFVASDIWQSIRNDLDFLSNNTNPSQLIKSPLWLRNNQPKILDKNWQDLRIILNKLDPNWGFWITWYDRVLTGEEQNWDMLIKIALIDPKDWNKGSDHINQMILRIMVSFGIKVTPNSKIIKRDTNGKFTSAPKFDLKAKLYKNACTKINLALEALSAPEKKNISGLIDPEMARLKSRARKRNRRPAHAT